MHFIPKELYDQIKTIMPICCIDFFIVHRHKILLWRRVRNPYKWERFFPGWRVLHGEIQQKAIERKLKEETWLTAEDISSTKLLGVFDTIFPLEEVSNATGHTINCTYIVSLKSEKDAYNHSLDLDHTEENRFPIAESQEFHPYINMVISEYLAQV